MPERVLRVSADNLNRLLVLAGESLVEWRWLRPFADSLQTLKRQQLQLSRKIETLRYGFPGICWSEQAREDFEELSLELDRSRELLTDRLDELEAFDRRSAHLSHRLYLEVLRTRMRPFGDGVRRFPRMVRDLARSLGKEVRLEIYGDSTQVGRGILERRWDSPGRHATPVRTSCVAPRSPASTSRTAGSQACARRTAPSARRSW